MDDYYGATFEYEAGGTFPVVLRDTEQTDEKLVYNLAEAEVLLATLNAAVEQARADLIKYVQVTFDRGGGSTGTRYTYIDPSGKLKVGDRVEVMTYDNIPNVVKVVALGRGTWTGPCKPVTAKMVRREL